MTTTTLPIPAGGEDMARDRLTAWIAEKRLPEPADMRYTADIYDWITVELHTLADLEEYRVAMGRVVVHLIDYLHHLTGERRWHALARVESLPDVPCVVRAVVEIAERTVEPEPAATKPLITDAAELAAAYGLDWPADACRCCGAKVIDGYCTGGGICQTGKCVREQGPVAVQRPGSGAS